MTIDAAIDISGLFGVEFATGACIAEPNATLNGEGFELDPPDVEWATGACIADPNPVMNGSGLELDAPDIEGGSHLTIPNPIAIMDAYHGVVLHTFARPVVAGDTAQVIDVGYYPDFTATPRTVRKRRPVTFRDATYGPTIVAWLWHYGDGTTGVTDPSTHRYSASGWYDIRLDVWSIGGEFASVVKRRYVRVRPGNGIISYW